MFSGITGNSRLCSLHTGAVISCRDVHTQVILFKHLPTYLPVPLTEEFDIEVNGPGFLAYRKLQVFTELNSLTEALG